MISKRSQHKKDYFLTADHLLLQDSNPCSAVTAGHSWWEPGRVPSLGRRSSSCPSATSMDGGGVGACRGRICFCPGPMTQQQSSSSVMPPSRRRRESDAREQRRRQASLPRTQAYSPSITGQGKRREGKGKKRPGGRMRVPRSVHR